MKKIEVLIAGLFCFYLSAVLGIKVLWGHQQEARSREYLVEANRIMRGMEEQGGFFMPDLYKMEQIDGVSFLEIKAGKETEDGRKTSGQTKIWETEEIEEFFRKKNGHEMYIEPLIIGAQALGFVRFDYKTFLSPVKELYWIIEGMIMLSGTVTLGILFYMKNKVIKPFLSLRDMPGELARGRLDAELLENKDRYFGSFVWGIAMLRDNLKAAKKKALSLEKEKKMLLLTISHDIKTPLNSIKLYARAIREGLYDTEEKRKKATCQIEKLSEEIEDFVRKIVHASSQEIVHIEVENTEFYLKDLAEQVQEYYTPKCRLSMTELLWGAYENKLLKGDGDRAFEVMENVMENAFKYGDGQKIEITFYEEEGCQIVKVKSFGNPVRTEEIPHLFDSFYRGSNVGDKEGNGLGLYICREMMRKMEGDIFVKREGENMSVHLVFQI